MAGLYGYGAARRIVWWQLEVLGWSETATAASEAAAGAQLRARVALELAGERVEG